MTHITKCDGVWKYVGSHTNVAGSHSQAVSTCGVSSKLPVESAGPHTPQQDLIKTYYRAFMNLPSSHHMTGTPAVTLHVTMTTHSISFTPLQLYSNIVSFPYRVQKLTCLVQGYHGNFTR